MDSESLVSLMVFISLGITAFSWWMDKKKKNKLKEDIDAIEGKDPFESRAKEIYDEQKRR